MNSYIEPPTFSEDFRLKEIEDYLNGENYEICIIMGTKSLKYALFLSKIDKIRVLNFLFLNSP